MCTVVLAGKISCLIFARCVHVDIDKEVKFFCFLFARCVYRARFAIHLYLNTLNYQVAAGLITWAWKGHNLFSNYFNSDNFCLYFFIIIIFFLIYLCINIKEDVRLSLLTMTSPNQMRDVLLFVCSKMADETNLSIKCQLQIEKERFESFVGDALSLAFRCARFCLASLFSCWFFHRVHQIPFLRGLATLLDPVQSVPTTMLVIWSL